MKTIVLDGIEYTLTPVKSPQASPKSVSEPVKDDIMKDYGVEEPKGVKKAVPTVSEYRERFKQRKLTLNDISKAKPNYEPLPNPDRALDKFKHKGESLFFGPGVQYDI